MLYAVPLTYFIVTRLQDSNNINGTIPSELAALEFLDQLFLQSENLVGTIPTELGALTFLKGLAFYGNVRVWNLGDVSLVFGWT